ASLSTEGDILEFSNLPCWCVNPRRLPLVPRTSRRLLESLKIKGIRQSTSAADSEGYSPPTLGPRCTRAKWHSAAELHTDKLVELYANQDEIPGWPGPP